MTEGGQTICLCMIVRDEAHVIERCLESVRPFVDQYAICDTGSKDKTIQKIEQFYQLDGRVFRAEWKDFATNRNHALGVARGSGCDFALIIDADDWLTAPPGYRLPDLTQDVYWLTVEHGSITYSRPQLVRLGRGCRWRGVLHEFLEVPDGLNCGTLPLTVHYGGDGARSKDPEKYRRDAEALEAVLDSDRDPDLRERYTFYLAQSYRDAGQPRSAFQWYHQRARMCGWEQEVYVSLLNAARLAEQTVFSDWQIEDYYTQATNADPRRVEALVALAKWLRLRSHFEAAYELLNDWRNRHGCPQVPPGALFAEPWAYQWGFWDELSLAAYFTEGYAISLDAALQALKGDPPPADRKRIIDNAQWALTKLQSASAPR